MQQYFAKDKNLTLEDGDYHHIKNVMKMKPGDLIKIVYDDITYTCKLIKVSDNSLFEVVSKEKKSNKSYHVSVAFSLIKEQKLDYLFQKCTECGADELIAVQTKRSVVKIAEDKMKTKKERWKRICKEAAEQSFRSNVPSISDVLSLSSLSKKEYDLKLLCSLNKNTKNIKKVLQKNNKCDKILIVIGPEGGFDPKEEEFLTENGFLSVSLGDGVLRAETASVVALSMINYEFMR